MKISKRWTYLSLLWRWHTNFDIIVLLIYHNKTIRLTIRQKLLQSGKKETITKKKQSLYIDIHINIYIYIYIYLCKLCYINIYKYIYVQSWKQYALLVITIMDIRTWTCTWTYDVWLHIAGTNEPKLYKEYNIINHKWSTTEARS